MDKEFGHILPGQGRGGIEGYGEIIQAEGVIIDGGSVIIQAEGVI